MESSTLKNQYNMLTPDLTQFKLKQEKFKEDSAFGVPSHPIVMLDQFSNQQFIDAIFDLSKSPDIAVNDANLIKTAVKVRLKKPCSFNTIELVKILKTITNFAKSGYQDDDFNDFIIEKIKNTLRRNINTKPNGFLKTREIIYITIALKNINYKNIVVLDLLEINFKNKLNIQKQTGDNIFNSFELYNIASAFKEFGWINNSIKILFEEIIKVKIQEPGFFREHEFSGLIKIFPYLSRNEELMRQFENRKKNLIAVKGDLRVVIIQPQLEQVFPINSTPRKIEEITQEIMTIDIKPKQKTIKKPLKGRGKHPKPQKKAQRKAASQIANISQTYEKRVLHKIQENRERLSDTRIINFPMSKKESPGELFDYMRMHFHLFTNANIVTFWKILAKRNGENQWGISLDDLELYKIINSTYNILGELDPQELAKITLAFAKLDCKDELFIYQLKSAIDKQLEDPRLFNIKNLAEIAFGFAEFGCDDISFNLVLMKLIEHNLKDHYFSNMHNLANVCWAFARLECLDPDFISTLKKSAMPLIQKFYDLLIWTPEGLSKSCEQNSYQFNVEDFIKLAWAFARFNYHDDELKYPILKIIEPYILNLHRFKPRELANLAWTFSKFKCENIEIEKALNQLIDWQLQESQIKISPSFDIYELASIIEAFSNFEYKDDNLISRIKTSIEDQQKKDPYLFNDHQQRRLEALFSNLKNEHMDDISARTVSTYLEAVTHLR